MSSISSSPRRPSTALTPLSSSTRLPYEAAEALLWERQNARANTHLHAQMKELQATHDAYDARITATEAVAEAAEAAVSRVRELGRKVEAIEDDEREGPFVKWCKEAVGQLQIAVDGMKGVRQRVSALDGLVERLGEDVDKVRDESRVAKTLLRRLEVLEDKRGEDVRMIRELEREVKTLRSARQMQEDNSQREGEDREAVEETYDETPADDNPLAVFYGIETRSPARRQESPAGLQGPEHTSTATSDQDPPSHRIAEAPTRFQGSPHSPVRTSITARHQNRSPSRCVEHAQRRYDDFPPPSEHAARPEDDSFDHLEATPNVQYGWENTQLFKNMQKELEALRAMCRTQEPKNSNETADTTQRPRETQLVHRDNNIGFSDATTEIEAENHGGDRRFHQGSPQGSVDALCSDIQLPSSPPKRTETQSARRKLMKRPSMYDPRLSSAIEQVRPEQVTPRSREPPGRISEPSLLADLPVGVCTFSKALSKRKREEDELAQRVTRPRLRNNIASSREPAVSTVRANRSVEDTALAEQMPFAATELASAPLPPTRKSNDKQKPPANCSVQQEEPQADSSRSEQSIVPAAKSAVPAAEVVKSRKTVRKSKPKPMPVPAQQQPHVAAPSSPKKAPDAVKGEAKGSRQLVGACKSCRSRHQKCDRTQPTCARCAKTGTSCEYPHASTVVTQSAARASSPKKKQALLPIKKSSNEAGRASERERSVTISPVAPRQKGPAKGQVSALLSKKPIATTAPTAASSRAPRAKNAQTSGAFPKE